MRIFDSILRRRWHRATTIAATRSGFMCSTTRRMYGSGGEREEVVLPVLIVGAGPVGLVLSMLLRKLGVRCVILEKSMSFSLHPQAHFINNRSMEVFHKLDGVAEEIQMSQPPVESWRKFVYCTSVTGTILGSVDHIQPQDLEQVVSPVSIAHFSQYKLTRLLLKKLEGSGFRIRTCQASEATSTVKNGEILMGHECVSFDSTNDGVNVTASYYKDELRMTKSIQCRFLVGADGAGSTVRRLSGINMKGENDLQKLVSVHFLSQDLGQYLLNERPGMLFFIFNRDAIGVLVAHDLKLGEFVLQMPFYPPQQKLEDFNPEMCEKLIFKLVGRNLEDIDVVDIKPWVMHAEVAEKFLTNDNHIILAGDAAHRFPPAGGFGMNTGIQDAHNLAWKLALVTHGISPIALLKTYETERRPVAIFNTQLSVQNFRAAMEVPSALGLDPAVANSVHQVINDGIGSVLPTGIQRVILDGIFSMGRAQLADAILSDSNPVGSARLARLKNIFEEGRSLQLQFPAEDLGFRYVDGALVSDRYSMQSAPEAPPGRRRDYVPSADPGSRLPHMKIRSLSTVSSKEVFSTLDLVSGDRVEFLLLIAPQDSSYKLASATIKAAKKNQVHIKVAVIWPEDTTVGSDLVGRSVSSPLDSYVNVVEVKRSRSSPSWWDLCKMNDRGAILVRPDEHIAWRTRSEVEGDPVIEMEKVFAVVLGFEQRDELSQEME
ncbi:putative polyketide hydroxylase [Drosera capensis]